MMRIFIHFAWPLSLFCWNVNLVAADTAVPPTDMAESNLVAAVNHARSGEWQRALELSNRLCEDQPEFHAAKSLQSLFQQQRLPQPADPVPISEEENEYQTGKVMAEISLRLRAYDKVINPAFAPKPILKLDERIKHALLIDLNQARLYLLRNENHNISILSHYYIGIGRQGPDKMVSGDLRTPVGVYKIVNELADNELQELYGIGAWPLNYPNLWDNINKRTGNGIWIHGVPRETYSRTPYSSRGCVTLSNHIFTGLRKYIVVGETPVVLTANAEWVAQSEQQKLADNITQHFLKWRDDWASLDFERYINHYSMNFNTGKENFEDWRKRKHAINKIKTSIDIDFENVSLFSYPGEISLIQIEFRQHYKSNNFNASSNKQQYWKLEKDGEWRIIFEGVL